MEVNIVLTDELYHHTVAEKCLVGFSYYPKVVLNSDFKGL